MIRSKLLLWVWGTVNIFKFLDVAEAADFTTELIDDEWLMTGTRIIMGKTINHEIRAKKDGQAGGQKANSLSDHIHKDGQGGGGTLEEKMDQVIDFFMMHQEKMTFLAETPAIKLEDRFWSSGVTKQISTIITPLDGLNHLLVDLPARGAGQVITFDFLQKIEKQGKIPTQLIYISHFGPFGVGTWGGILDTFDQFKRNLQTAELQTLWEEATKAVNDERVAFNNLPEKSRTIEMTTHLENAKTALRACSMAEFSRLNAQTRDSINLIIDPWPLQVQEMCSLALKIKTNCVKAKNICAKVSKAIIRAGPNKGPPEIKPNTAWGPKREKRDTDDTKKENTMVRLGAQIELLDSDPNSEFTMTKINFKEVHSGGEETHTWDMERNVLVTDPNIEGSTLTAEVQVGGEMKVAKVETAGDKKFINIVLSPRID